MTRFAALLSICLVAAPSFAAPIRVTLSGSITESLYPHAPHFQVGDPVTVTIEYESENLNPDFGYSPPLLQTTPTLFSWQIGSTLWTGFGTSVRLANDTTMNADPVGGTWANVDGLFAWGITTPRQTVGGHEIELEDRRVTLIDEDATAFSEQGELPAVPTPPSEFEIADFAFTLYDYGPEFASEWAISGPVTNVTWSVIPEPTTVLLLGAGLGGIGLRGRRRAPISPAAPRGG